MDVIVIVIKRRVTNDVVLGVNGHTITIVPTERSKVLHRAETPHTEKGFIHERVDSIAQTTASRLRAAGDKSGIVDRGSLRVRSPEGPEIQHSGSRGPDKGAGALAIQLGTGRTDYLT